MLSAVSVTAAANPSILVIPVNACEPDALFRAIDVVPIFKVEAPNTPVGIVPDSCAAGIPVALVKTIALGVPKLGVISVGEVAKTKLPVPVSSVTAVIKFAEEGVAKKAATPVPIPLIPVVIGNPVAFVSVIDAGVPSIGAVRVTTVPFVVAPVIPAKAPALLY